MELCEAEARVQDFLTFSKCPQSARDMIHGASISPYRADTAINMRMIKSGGLRSWNEEGQGRRDICMGSFLEEGTRHMGSGEQPRVGTGILGEEAGQRLEG